VESKRRADRYLRERRKEEHQSECKGRSGMVIRVHLQEWRQLHNIPYQQKKNFERIARDFDGTDEWEPAINKLSALISDGFHRPTIRE
jgi:hypothetical protein